jgi:predicted PolB exonuclease-like 3'-5' exonuclease
MNILVFDLETVPDIEGFSTAKNLHITDKTAIREMIGDDFPKLIYHKIACITALVADTSLSGYKIRGCGTQHIGNQTEKQMLKGFLDLIDHDLPRIITFNGHSFDLPVVRYRAMINDLVCPGLSKRQYFHRYSDDHIDLCDRLSSFNHNGKATLDEICRIMGLSGKPEGIDGSKVEEYVNDGRIEEVADYCESDVIDTYRLFLKHEHFMGRLTTENYRASEAEAVSLMKSKK